MITTNSISQDTPLILVADDDRSIRTLLKVAMEEEGYRVITAKDGEECLVEYHRCQPDMVLLDAIMPEMDGFTCCKNLCQLNNGHHLPILMITALDDQDSIDQAFAAGAVDYITKPIHWAVLAQRVKRLLTSTKALRQVERKKNRLNKQERWMEFLRNLAQKLANSAVLESFFQDVQEGITSLTEEARVIIAPKKDSFRLKSVNGGDDRLEKSLLGLESVAQASFQEGKVIFIEDVSQSNFLETAMVGERSRTIAPFQDDQIQSLIIMPIVSQNALWGCLGVIFPSPQIWESWEQDAWQHLSYLLAIAVS